MGAAITKNMVTEELEKLQKDWENKNLPDVTKKCQEDLDLLKNTTLEIAITGVSGAGKSSLVNALRGMTDFEDGAAETGETETTRKRDSYLHPTFPNVTMWDLPGIGTPNFEAKEYLKKVKFEKYDFFIIIASNRFTENDVLLAREIRKMNKRFYYVRTRVDSSIDSESKKPNYSEEKCLEKIREYCCENLTQAGESNPRVFLISRWHLDKYDFPLLQETLEDELDDLKRDVLILGKGEGAQSTATSGVSGTGAFLSKAALKIGLAKLKEAMAQSSLEELVVEPRQELVALDHVKLDIAITGVTGAGKSSLVNALRNMTDHEEGSAKTGVMQTTMDLHGYPHPLFPNVTLWDLPGFGTLEYEPQEYFKKVNFNQYDFFIIVASERFNENDVLLAQEIKKMQKKYYYVYSKIDLDMDAGRRRPNFNENQVIEKIKTYCCENFRMAGELSPRVFLMSRWHLNKYDFPLFQETLEKELDGLKRHALILALPVFSREILEKKTTAMETLIWKAAIVSCVLGAIPVPGLSLFCELGILVRTLLHFSKVFGLDEESLRRAAKQVSKDYQVLKSAVKKSPRSSEITPELVIGLLNKSVFCGTLIVFGLVFDFGPVLGLLAGPVSSFVTTLYMVKSFLKDVVEDAESVRAKAAEP
ncbi:LOW QUALITY PROTEIN: interferon-inducible GTPase 5-like [Sphaerodactylus townsendi]|uniref:LOW QUALITY PROTEIN: interferon-inducible GTPase 5-like n=1 Tax=Sphaerodactylus townsendi TaxID=933632 RepID=UPI0020274A55|nr:LOW QUALITY PROTEIN: interferon-inducible GTPase 5-like [Sphaerodactylus townsendi]